MAEGHMENGKFHPHNSNSESVSSDQVVNQDVEPDLDSNEVDKLKHRKD